MRTAGKIPANIALLVLLFSFLFCVKAHREPAPQKPALSVAKDTGLLKTDKTFDFEDDSFETESEDDTLPLFSTPWLSLYNNRVTNATVPDASPTLIVNSRYLLVTRSLRI